MKSWAQGRGLEACVEVVAVSKTLSQSPRTHAWPLEAIQNAAPVSRISIMGKKSIFANISKGTKGTFARITIKIAKGIIALVFNQGSSKSVPKRILKVQSCLYTLPASANWR